MHTDHVHGGLIESGLDYTGSQADRGALFDPGLGPALSTSGAGERSRLAVRELEAETGPARGLDRRFELLR